MLQQHKDEIDFLNTMFGFLQRKTSCFNGPKAETNFVTLIQTLQNQLGEYKNAKAAGGAPPVQEPEAPRPVEKEAKKQKQEPVKAVQPPKQKEQPKPKEPEAGASSAESSADSEDKEEKRVVLPGNGGATDKYTWTQTLGEVTVSIPLPPGTRAKQLDVRLKGGSVYAGIKGQEPIINSNLFAKIQIDESMWHVDDCKTLVLNFQKVNAMEWWKCVCEGDEEIDTTKVEPENSNLSDLDGETRQVVEKMMFDQRAKAAGMPTSEERQKQDMMKKFMAAHPEMDFSKAKIM